jgi:hypothetical protein
VNTNGETDAVSAIYDGVIARVLDRAVHCSCQPPLAKGNTSWRGARGGGKRVRVEEEKEVSRRERRRMRMWRWSSRPGQTKFGVEVRVRVRSS